MPRREALSARLSSSAACVLRFVHASRVSGYTTSMGVASRVVVKPLGPHAVAIIDAMKTIPIPALVELELSIHPTDVLWTAT